MKQTAKESIFLMTEIIIKALGFIIENMDSDTNPALTVRFLKAISSIINGQVLGI